MILARKIFLIVSFFLYLAIFPSSVLAASCTASVSPSEVEANSDTNFAFSVTNTGENAVTMITIARPSENFTLENYGVAGWNVSGNSSYARLTGGTVAPGATFNFNYHGIAGSSEAASANWQVSTDDGTGEIGCTGSLGTAIVGTADTAPPLITNLAVSGITSSSVTVSWTTDEPATTSLEYGLTGEYGTTIDNPSLVTSHSVNVTGLAANTTYYYLIRSIDESGNSAFEEFNTFTTSAAASSSTTTTTTTTSTPTPTATVTPTPTPSVSAAPVVVADVTRPSVDISSELENPYEEAPTMEGSVSDNRVISSVEYSTDGGENWLPMDEVSGLGSSSVEFSFTPQLTEDDNYDVVVRAIDSSDNEGRSESVLIVIDRLPPRVGGNLLSVGPYSLLPDDSGIMVTLAGIEQRITLSTVGGPTSVDLLARRIGGGSGDRMFSLGRSPDTGLWRGAINFSLPGVYELLVRAEDGAGNKTERKLGMVMVLRNGRVNIKETGQLVSEGVVTLYYQDPVSEMWTIWDGEAFGQANPQMIGGGGEYKYFLPPGSYYMEIKVPGKAKLISNIFTLDQSRALNADFTVKDRETFKLGPFRIPIPDMFAEKADVVLPVPKFDELEAFGVVGEEAQEFLLPDTAGGEVGTSEFSNSSYVLTFVNTWSPQSVEQISLIDQAVFNRELPLRLVVTQESEAKVDVFAARGGYISSFAVDKDGELVEEYGVSSLPMHYFIDRYGFIKKVIVDVLSVEEVKGELEKLN